MDINDNIYSVNYVNRCAEISNPVSKALVYKIPYEMIKNKLYEIDVPNKFIVYILYGQNKEGQDMIYVGKSTTGINIRPKSHEDKWNDWTTCYVVTDLKERTILNDGSAQYLEHEICNRINNVKRYYNTTKQTNSSSANSLDKRHCQKLLTEVYVMLYILGLDLLERDKNTQNVIAEQSNTISGDSYEALYNKIIKIIREVEPNVAVETKKYYQNITIDGAIIVSIKIFKRSGVRLYVDCRCNELNVEKYTIVDASVKHKIYPGKCYIELNNESDLSVLGDLIRQIIAIKK